MFRHEYIYIDTEIQRTRQVLCGPLSVCIHGWKLFLAGISINHVQEAEYYMHACVYVCMYLCMCVCVCVCSHVHVCLRMCKCLCVRAPNVCVYVCVYVHVCVSGCVHMHMCVCMHMYMYATMQLT